MADIQDNTFTAYLGIEFQQKLMWQLLVEPEFAEKVIPDLAIEYFDDPNFRRLFIIILEYIKVFNLECKKLDANFNVEISQRAQKGNTLKHLDLKGHTPSQVLSEGEQHAISLADFLTEIQIGKKNKGIIFDDPVNPVKLFFLAGGGGLVAFHHRRHGFFFGLFSRNLSLGRNLGHFVFLVAFFENVDDCHGSSYSASAVFSTTATGGFC